MKKTKRSIYRPSYKKGGIHVDPEHAGDFTVFAQQMGMGVQAAAAHVLANKEQFSPERVKQANFARNAAGWRKQEGGGVSREPGVGSQMQEEGVGSPEEQDGYAKNSFFNRLFNRNNILEEQIRNEYKALKQIPLRKMHVDYASGEDAATMAQLHHNPEYIGPGTGLRDRQIGNVLVPKGKLLANLPSVDDSAYVPPIVDDPRFVTIRYPGHYTTLINPAGLSKEKIKSLAATDFVSHGLKDDPVYNGMSEELLRLLIDRYGDEDVRNNGWVDAYVRGLISDDPEYDVYRKEMDFVPQALKDKIVNYVRSGKRSESGVNSRESGVNSRMQEGGGVDVQHPFANGYMPAVVPGSPTPTLAPVRREMGNVRPAEAPPQFTPFFTTPEQYKEYQKVFQKVSGEALDPEDDQRYLKYTPYHPKPNGYDCINGTCGLDEAAGLRWSHPPDPDVKRYLSNKDFLRNIRQGKEDYTELNALPDFDGTLYPGDHFILLNKKNEPHHSMEVMNVERDETGKPWRIRFIENDGDTKFHNQTTMTMDEFWDRFYRGDDAREKFRPNDVIVVRPGKYLAQHMTKEQKAQQAAEELQAQAKARQNYTVDNPMGRQTWSLWDTFQKGGVYSRESGVGGPLAGTPTVGGGRELEAGKGGVSREGYKADSPDRFNAFNIIPSNQITMQNVPHPVMGVDNLGNQQLMLPGYHYVFPGSYVVERPMAAFGGRYQLGGQQLKTYGKGGSFANAFAEARKALGAGHTFEWNGKTYTTNVAGETGLVDAPAKPLPPEVPPQEYRNWEEIKAERERQNALSDEGRIVSTYENTEDPYLIVDKKNALLKLYHGPSLVKQYEVGVGANPGDAQTVTKLRNGKPDWSAGNMSTGAGVYTISNKQAHNKDYFNAPSFNMVNDQGVEVATSLHGTPVARRWRFDNGNVEDNRMSNGCINGKCYDLEDLYHNQQLPVGAKVYVLPEDAGNQFQVVDGKPVLRVAPKNAANYNSYTDSQGRVQKGQGVNRTTQTLVYQPIRTILDKAAFQKDVYQWDDFNDENEYQNTTRPFVNGLVQNKQKIMQAAQIPSDVYNDIVKVAFGIYGTESNFGDTHSAVGNLARAANKFFSPSSSSSPDVQAKFNTYGADDATNSVGYTQIRWGQLNDDEKKALAKVGITSNRDFLNPEKAAVGTATILGVRYNQQLTPEQKKDIFTYLPTKWNSRANYSDRVKQNSRYLKVEQMENPGVQSRESIVGSQESGVKSRGLRRAQQGGTMGVIPPFTLETRMHEPRTMDSMLPADSPVYQQKQTLDAKIKQREILSRTPAQQAAYEREIVAKRIAEENRREWLRQQELDRRTKAMEQSDEIQDNTSLFSPERWSRQNLATIAQAIPERGRLFPESVGGAGQFFDDYINPLVWVGNLAKGLGESPLEAQQTNSVVPYLRAFGTPLAAGALGINPVTTVTDPLKGVFTAKGLTGQVNNVWKNVVKSNAISTVKDKAIEAAKDTYLPLPQQNPVTTGTPAPAPTPAPTPTPTPSPAPVPSPPPVNPSFKGFTGTSLFNPQQQMVAMYQLKNTNSAVSGNPDTLHPSQQVADLMFVNNNGVADTTKGRFEVPIGLFLNQMTSGVSTLKDTTGLSQYRVPLTGGTSYQEGGPVDETQAQKNWLLSYLQSPKYLERLKMEGFENPGAEQKARLQNLQNVPVKYSRDLASWQQEAYMPREYKGMMFKKGWEPAAPDPVPIFGIETPGTLYMGRQYLPGHTPEAKFATTPAHGFSHVLDDGDFRIPNKTIDKIYNYTNKQDADLVQLNGQTFGYLNDPSEVVARMQAVRYLLNKANIYDARTQDFDEAAYEKMLNDPTIQGNSDFQELFGTLKGNDMEKKQRFMDLMNTVASRSNGAGSTMARYGGRVSRGSALRQAQGDGSPEIYGALPFMQVGGIPGNTGLNPYGLINPFDTNPNRQRVPFGGVGAAAVGTTGQPQGIAPTGDTGTGLYPYGVINPFDRDPSTFTKGTYGASATPAVAPPAPPSFSDTGLYPYGVINPFDMDPYLLSTKENGTNSSAQTASKTAASNTGSKPPPDTKYKWGTNIGAATKLVGGLSAFNSILDSNNRNRYKDQELIYNLGDNKGPLWPGDWEERRGDYTVNGGFFRPDRMYPTQFGVAQMGGTHFSEPVQDVAVTGTPQLPVLPMPVAAPPVRPEPRGNFQNVEMPSIKVNEHVKPNKATWDAFNYYVTEKGLEPLAAAAIVGNLYRESGLQPDVNEKGHTGNGRGIAQWDVRDRWKGLNKWAQQQGRDPYDLYTQLDYVLAEPGEGEKALKALAEARTPEEAAYVFGKVYERPLDKKHLAVTKNPARWDIRAGIARQMFDSYMAQMANRDVADLSQGSQMGSADGEGSQGMARGGEFRYQQGGEYVVTPEQLQRILANGGEVEMLPPVPLKGRLRL